MKTQQQHREEIVRLGKLLHEHFFVAATDGNLSVRMDEDRILCTPTVLARSRLKK